LPTSTPTNTATSNRHLRAHQYADGDQYGYANPDGSAEHTHQYPNGDQYGYANPDGSAEHTHQYANCHQYGYANSDGSAEHTPPIRQRRSIRPPAPPTAGASATITAQVASSSDDANQDGTALDLGSATVWLGDGAFPRPPVYTGLRFTNLAIPPGATINSARLQVYSSQSQVATYQHEPGRPRRWATAQTFSASSMPSQRTLTTQKVGAQLRRVLADKTPGTRLDEMAPVIQEVVNRGGLAKRQQSVDHLARHRLGPGAASLFPASTARPPRRLCC